MAKRKRLSPAQSDYLAADGPGLETKTMPLGPAPIAQVAGEAAASAALQELAGEFKLARDEGRLIQTLDEAQIDEGYLVRDRLVAEDDELRALMESLRARGQQTPVEVVALEAGRFGLISGWRRLTALRRLFSETQDPRFARVRAILRQPETAAEAYVAMVEENEIRVGLSYYERARVAAKAVEQGVFETEKQALLELYASASRSKRSKIRSFLALYHAADDLLRFPASVGERLGLTLAKTLEGPNDRGTELRALLQAADVKSAEAEQSLLQSFVEPPSELSLKDALETNSDSTRKAAGSPVRAQEDVVQDVSAVWKGRSLTLSGAGVSASFRQDLFDWIRKRSAGDL